MGGGGGGPSRAIKFLYAPEQPEQGDLVPYAPAPPSPHSTWAMKPPS
jgi:hypothetical protein